MTISGGPYVIKFFLRHGVAFGSELHPGPTQFEKNRNWINQQSRLRIYLWKLHQTIVFLSQYVLEKVLKKKSCVFFLFLFNFANFYIEKLSIDRGSKEIFDTDLSIQTNSIPNHLNKKIVHIKSI